MPRTQRRVLLLLAGGFLLCGWAHILLYQVPYADCVVQIVCAAVVLSWALSIRKRVTEGRIRRLLLAVAGCLILLLSLQVIRYVLLPETWTVKRYVWYGYYIPMLSMPLLILGMALLIYRPGELPLPRVYGLLVALGTVMFLGVLTNDLHNAAFSFPEGTMTGNGDQRAGWLYVLIDVFMYGVYLVDYGILFRKSRRCGTRRARLLPVIPIVLGLLLHAFYLSELSMHLMGLQIWNLGELHTFLILTSLESCIQAGMIPANIDYEGIFPRLGFPAAILDGAGRAQYVTEGAVYPFPETPGTVLRRHPISGGEIVWSEDRSALLDMNAALSDAVGRIEDRNAFLTEAARVRAEEAEKDTRSRIYNRIFAAVRPQLADIQAILEQEGDFRQRLKPICVRSAYIKRRSNMELLSADGTLPAEELYLALSETMHYVRLAEVYGAVSLSGAGYLPAEMVIAAYADAEKVIEEALDTLSELMIYLESGPGRLTLRMMLRAGAMSLSAGSGAEPDRPFTRQVSVTKDGPDMLLVFAYREGGEDL